MSSEQPITSVSPSSHPKIMCIVAIGLILASLCSFIEKRPSLRSSDLKRVGAVLLLKGKKSENDTFKTLEVPELRNHNETNPVLEKEQDTKLDPSIQRIKNVTKSNHLDSSLRILLMGGCSGSTITQSVTRDLLEAHGVSIYRGAPFEVMNRKNNAKLEDARQQLRAKGVKSPTNDQVSIELLRVFQQQAADKGQVLAFKANPEKRLDLLKQILSPGVEVRMAHMQRRNVLDLDICLVRDCKDRGSPPLGYPVYALNGTRSKLCFARRKQKGVTTLALFDTANFTQRLQQKQAGQEILAQQARQLAAQQQNPSRPSNTSKRRPMMVTQYYEDLFAFEYTNDEPIFQSSIRAWSLFLQSLVEVVDEQIIADVLAPLRNSRPPPVPHNQLIFNYDQVVAELETNPSMVGLHGVVDPKNDRMVDVASCLRRPSSD